MLPNGKWHHSPPKYECIIVMYLTPSMMAAILSLCVFPFLFLVRFLTSVHVSLPLISNVHDYIPRE